jgi:glycosyltransferase involved in cell wall biosynthesis
MNIKNYLTIVIPCKNERLLIVETLKYLNKQKHISGTKVIISDSSDDNTIDIVNSFVFDNLDIKIISGGTPSVARNNGFSSVETPYVLFLDSDIFLLKPTIIYECLSEIISKSYHLISIKLRCKGKYSFVYPMFEFFRDIISFKYPFAVGGFMLFDSAKFTEVGKFDELNLFAEDFNLSLKISPKKFKIMNLTGFTPDRRFKKKGLFYMVNMAVKSMINKNNPEFFNKDHDYWK